MLGDYLTLVDEVVGSERVVLSIELLFDLRHRADTFSFKPRLLHCPLFLSCLFDLLLLRLLLLALLLGKNLSLDHLKFFLPEVFLLSFLFLQLNHVAVLVRLNVRVINDNSDFLHVGLHVFDCFLTLRDLVLKINASRLHLLGLSFHLLRLLLKLSSCMAFTASLSRQIDDCLVAFDS